MSLAELCCLQAFLISKRLLMAHMQGAIQASSQLVTMQHSHCGVLAFCIACRLWLRPGSTEMQVNYRESISKVADVRYVHKKQSGGSGQFADVAIRFEPSEPGAGFVFKSDIKGGTVPKEYIPGVVKVSPSLSASV